MSAILKIALQKSGRLHDDSVRLLEECGISFSRGGSTLKSLARNFPVEFLFLRDDDIPGYVADGVAHLGLAGQNVVQETGYTVTEVLPLGYAHCRLSLAVPKGMDYTSVRDLAGKRIATSYPNILGQYLASQGVQAHIHEISGSVEIAPGIGLADAICDLVSSGSTLAANGLRETDVVMRSEAVLIAHPHLTPEQQEILDQLRFRIEAVNRAKPFKYILMNAPNAAIPDILKVLPGMKSPTIMPLGTDGWSSLHSVVHEEDFWKVIGGLKAAGAEGILIIPIEKMF